MRKISIDQKTLARIEHGALGSWNEQKWEIDRTHTDSHFTHTDQFTHVHEKKHLPTVSQYSRDVRNRVFNTKTFEPEIHFVYQTIYRLIPLITPTHTHTQINSIV